MSSVERFLSGLRQRWKLLVRLLGLALLAWLLLRIDISGALAILGQTKLGFALLAGLLLIPLIAIKALRWMIVIGRGWSWTNYYRATLVYFSGLFLGFLTPGRLGEFIRLIYARRQLQSDSVAAIVTVLVDRLFDLAALLFVGGIAVLSLPAQLVASTAIGWGFVALGLLVPILLLSLTWGNWLVEFFHSRDLRIGRFSLNRWLIGIGEVGIGHILLGTFLTIVAYLLFYGQGLSLVRALGLELDYFQVAYTMSLASLVALLPISVSGLGTREWAITLYLSEFGIAAEGALAFSALIFIAFNLWGSLLGGISWLIYPQAFRWEVEEVGDSEDLPPAALPAWLNRWQPKGE